jgi:hypothetical protein
VVQRGDVAGEQVHLPEVDVPGVPHGEAADPGAALLRRRQRGGEVVEDAGGGVRVVELDGDELHDPREEVADADVLLHLLEEGHDLARPVQSEPHQVTHRLRPPCGLVDAIPGEATEDVESEAAFDVSARTNIQRSTLSAQTDELLSCLFGERELMAFRPEQPAAAGLTASRSCACRTPSCRCGRPCMPGRSGRRRRRGRRPARTRGPACAPAVRGRSRTRRG